MSRGHDTGAVAAFWDDDERAAFLDQGGLEWQQVEAVVRRWNAKISGAADIDWIAHLTRTYFRGRTPLPSCLSLCCGRGRYERDLIARGVVETCLGLDVSPASIAAAQAKAAAEGLEGLGYEVRNINRIELPRGAFDLIIAHSALHHIEALEHVLPELAAALRPDGLLVSMDYCGPNRCALPAHELDLCDASLRLLPERYRQSVSFGRLGRLGPGIRRSPGQLARLAWRKLASGTLVEALRCRVDQRRRRRSGAAYIKDRAPRIDPVQMAIHDPSEAVRSSEIREILHQALSVIEETPLGGNILWMVLDDIAGNFAPDDPVAQRLLEMLFTIEDTLLEAGEAESHFWWLVARPERGAPSSETPAPC